MNIVADRLPDKIFRHIEAFCQFPEFCTAGGDGCIQGIYRHKSLDGPFVGFVFVTLTAVNGSMNTVKLIEWKGVSAVCPP